MSAVDRRLETAVEAVLVRGLAHIQAEDAARQRAEAHWQMAQAQRLRDESAAIRRDRPKVSCPLRREDEIGRSPA